ncbi:MAG: InlB B-repeat-containing protein [Clostridia bacterium]|nr:InlB B-repeat-containing protein [Clostridia bacterium]
MKKTVFLTIAIVIMISSFFVLSSCGEEETITDFTISYHDANGLQSITVQKGSSYSIDYIPEKAGHTFLGWFNQETGGTQYVGATGACISPFNDSQNLTLFPQFAPKNYTLVLDYQEAEVTGSRSFEVKYNESLPNLPTNLTVDHKVFNGWYTAPNGKGTQIADKYGVLPTKNKLNESNFDLSNNDAIVTLYASFELEKYNVTLYFDSNEPEEIKAAYGTKITDIIYETRVNGQAVLTWSKTRNDTSLSNVFTGKITQDVILYATEYAPVINFDTDGGEDLPPIINRAGTNIVLPTPVKELYQFIGWQNNNEDYTSTTMPSESVTLTAKWQAKLIFDENGGEKVDDISLPQGQKVTLPTTTKSGYIFAGWYDTTGNAYTTTAMPSDSIKLKAGWYAMKTETIVLKAKDDDASYTGLYQDYHKGPESTWRRVVDLSGKIPENGARITFTLNWDMGCGQDATRYNAGFYFYDNTVVSDANYLGKSLHTVESTKYKTYSTTQTFDLRSNTLYLCYYAYRYNDGVGSYYRVYFHNIWIEVSYADISTLYI